jgi:hypothetical protein
MKLRRYFISGAIKNRYLTMTVRPTTLIHCVHRFILTTQGGNNLQCQSKIDSNFYGQYAVLDWFLNVKNFSAKITCGQCANHQLTAKITCGQNFLFYSKWMYGNKWSIPTSYINQVFVQKTINMYSSNSCRFSNNSRKENIFEWYKVE